MKILFSLLKAIMSQDMDLFRYKVKKNSSKFNKILFSAMLSIIVMCSIGMYIYMFAEKLNEVNLTYLILPFSMIVPTILTLMESIYKSQSILFETTDNNLLFSLPIKKSIILLAKLIKMYIFQYLYNLLFLIPSFAIYIFFEIPSINFYIISFLMTFLLPIIPTVIGSTIGFIIKKVSVNFKSKKLMQTMLMLILFTMIFMMSFNLDNIFQNIVNNATSINDIITKIYYPIGVYTSLINDFNLYIFIKLICINFIPLILFIAIISKFYFKTISKSNENMSIKIKRKVNIKGKGSISALVFKELKRYFSSTVYMFNTFFGLALLLIATIGMCINFNGMIHLITATEISQNDLNMIYIYLPKIFFGLIIAISFMTSITSSSISIEGKTFNITKSLPINESKILLSKIIFSDLITIPITLLCNIIFFIYFKIGIFDIINIMLISILVPNFNAIIGLLFNLKYPKMNATSDAEVVKQSTSSLFSVFFGVIIAALLIITLFLGSKYIKLDYIVITEVIMILIANIISWNILKTKGAKKFREIEI